MIAVRRIPDRMRLPLLVYGVTQLGFLFWWVALYPGLLSYDSMAYVRQVTNSAWSTSHSVTYNAFVWLSLQATGGLGLLSLVQTVLFAAGIAYTVAGLRSLLNGHERWLAAAAIAIPFIPSLGVFTTYISKDAGFVICQIFLVGTLARIVVARRTPGRPLRFLLLAAFVEFAGLALFRQNGLLVVLVAAAVAALVLSGVRIAILLAGIGAIGLSLLLNLAVFPAIGVNQARSDLLLGPAYADIAVVYHDRPSALTRADLAVLARVAPLETWSGTANCYDADDTTRNLNLNAAAANSQQLFQVWQRLVKRAPDEVIDARVCRGSIAWAPLQTGTVKTVGLPLNTQSQLARWRPRVGAGNPYQAAISQDPLNNQAFALAKFLHRASTSKTVVSVFWRGALWCYVGYLAVLLFMRRAGDRGLLALISVALANQLVVMVNNPAQLVRYMMGPIFLGILLLPLFTAWPRERPAAAGGAAEPAPASTRRPPADPALPPPAPPAAALRQADTHPIPPGAPDSIDGQQSSVMERREANTGSASAAERHNKVFEDS